MGNFRLNAAGQLEFSLELENRSTSICVIEGELTAELKRDDEAVATKQLTITRLHLDPGETTTLHFTFEPVFDCADQREVAVLISGAEWARGNNKLLRHICPI
mgnify:FL=1